MRKIPNNLLEWIEAIGEVEEDEIDSVLEGIPFNDKKKFLWWHEINRVVIEKNPHLTMQEAYDQTSALEPFRDMLMEKLAVLFEG